MLRISGGWFSVRLVRELDGFFVLYASASYTRKYTVSASVYYIMSLLYFKMKVAFRFVALLFLMFPSWQVNSKYSCFNSILVIIL